MNDSEAQDIAIRFRLEKLKIEIRDKWRDDEDLPLWKAAIKDMSVREEGMLDCQERLTLMGKNVHVQNGFTFFEADGKLYARSATNPTKGQDAQ